MSVPFDCHLLPPLFWRAAKTLTPRGGSSFSLGCVLLVLSSSIAPAAPAQTLAQFNLSCVGSAVRKFDGKDVGESVFTTSIRVDLDKNLWCVDDCSAQLPISKVTDNELLLQQSNGPDMDVYIAVNRRNGKLSQAVSLHPVGGNGKVMDVTMFGSCQKRPFVPMPEKQF
jgi:hypothetical protein